MANTFTAAPAVLSEIVLAGLKGRLGVLSAFSTNLTTNAVGKSIQVNLVSGGVAKEFSKANGGYKEGDNADLTGVTVLLKHYHSTKEFTPDEVGEYGEQYLANAFVPEAINQLSKKLHALIGAELVNANFSANEVITAANFNYAQVVDLNTDLNDAKAGDPRCLLVNGAYAGALRKDATLTAPFNQAGQSSLISSGLIGTIAGFQVFEFTDLPTNSENLAAFACGADALAIGMGLPYAGMFPGDVSTATDPSGLSVQVLRAQDTDGVLRFTATMRFGVKTARGTAGKRVKTA
jgi:hypothetical protein